MRETSGADSTDELLGLVDKLQEYRTVEILKQSPQESTILVQSPNDTQLICKIISCCEKTHPYELFETQSHPFIPKVYKCAHVGDELVVLMERLEGPTLKEQVNEYGSFQASCLMESFQGLLDAVSFIHTAFDVPVIHRDIKPENIIMTSMGAKLIDFGIARTWDPDADSDTRLMGTNGYAAPEQFGFRQSDVRTDIYALGMTLRFALTGVTPSQETTVEPPSFASVLSKACEFDPEQRYATVKELAYALQLATVKLQTQDSLSQTEEGRRGSTAASNRGRGERVTTHAFDPTADTPSSQPAKHNAERPQDTPRNPTRDTRPAATSPVADTQNRGPQQDLRVPPGARVAYRIPPSKRKPSAWWRIFQVFCALMAIMTIYEAVRIQMTEKGYGLFTGVVMMLGICGLPAYYLCDPFDVLRKHGAFDKSPVKRFFILMGIGFLIAVASAMLEAYVLHTITFSS